MHKTLHHLHLPAHTTLNHLHPLAHKTLNRLASAHKAHLALAFPAHNNLSSLTPPTHKALSTLSPVHNDLPRFLILLHSNLFPLAPPTHKALSAFSPVYNALNRLPPGCLLLAVQAKAANVKAVLVSAAAVVFGGDAKMALLLLLAVSRAMATAVTEVSSQRGSKEARQYQQRGVGGLCKAWTREEGGEMHCIPDR